MTLLFIIKISCFFPTCYASGTYIIFIPNFFFKSNNLYSIASNLWTITAMHAKA